VFSDLRCTRETAAAAPELTLSCSVKSINDQIFVNFVRRRMMSSMYGNGRPIKLRYATRSPCGRSDVSMEKTDLSCRFETTQSDGLKPLMTRPSTTAPPASETTAVVIRDRCARADLSRLLLSCTNVPLPNWAPPYHAGSLSQSSNRYAVRCLWLVPLLSIVCLSVIACVSSRSLHRMLCNRTGSPHSLASVVARIWLVPTCATVHACFFLRIVYVFLPLPEWISLSPLLPTSVPRFLPSI